MSIFDDFHKAMPTMAKHAGIWEGIYTHIDVDANVIDRHKTRVVCEFPTEGEHVYIQHNHFMWEDGREYKARLPGVYRDGRLWWDLDTFHGSSWETDEGLIMLDLDRKDDPGANFYEIIALGKTGQHRARTWHWFKDGKLFKRTLCDETKIG
ncbi:hypothetical protein [Hirschia litorea]|uniref:DUF3598 domain-containing protein n=1 Tax=Hirschia litorea TaxID=1199156 RepID=A0ABW2IPD6_9PROT